jgi:hypothetical protein
MQLRLSRNLNQSPAGRVLTRLGAAGFLFFLAKGLVWLAIGGLALIGIL